MYVETALFDISGSETIFRDNTHLDIKSYFMRYNIRVMHSFIFIRLRLEYFKLYIISFTLFTLTVFLIRGK